MFRTKQIAFGLDVSDDSVRAAQFKGRNKKIRLVSLGEVKIPSGIVEDGKVTRTKALADAIKSLLPNTKPRGIRAKNVICCLPESKVYTHILEIPKMSKDKLSEAIKWEIEEFIPLSVNQVYLDWEVVGEKEGKFKVLVAASPKNIVDSYLKTLEMAGLKVLALEMESRSLARVLIEKTEKREIVLLVDIGGRTTNLTIFDGNAIQYSTTIPIAGGTFTRKIVTRLNVSVSHAEEMKKRCGLDSRKEKGKVLAAIRDSVDEILREIKDTVEFYEAQSIENNKIEKIILCGGSANMPKILEYFRSRLKYNIEIADPKKIIALYIPKKTARYLTRDKAISFATCLGLALRGVTRDPVSKEINLIPQEWQKVYEERGIRRFISLITTVLILFGLFVTTSFIGSWFYLKNTNQRLLTQIEKEKEIFEAKDPKHLREFAEDFNQRVAILSFLQKHKQYWSMLFVELKNLKPPGVEITKFSTDKKGKIIKINLEGRAFSRDDILQFKQNLEDSAMFEHIELPLSSLSVKENVIFEMNFTVSEDKLSKI